LTKGLFRRRCMDWHWNVESIRIQTFEALIRSNY